MADEEIETPDAAPEAAETETEAVVEEAAPEEATEVAPPPAPPAEVLAPKERRRRARAAKAPAPRAQRSPQERQAERDEQRAVKLRARRHERAHARAEKPASVAVPATTALEHSVGQPKVRQGVVVSDKADKTITVRVEISRRHRRYKKVVRSTKTFHAHDESNEAHAGDLVRIVETRPLSATKRWRLTEVLERAR